MLNNILCAITALVGIAVIIAEVRSDEERISPYSGFQPGVTCDYELDNTLPPTYTE